MTNKNPLVSIIIPTYNRVDLIKKTLQSVQSQTYQNWECLIIDDGSVDNTKAVVEEICKKDDRFSFHQNSRAKGAPGARNTGLELSKGEFISFFDSDDELLPIYIENKIKYFSTNSKLDLVISLSKWKENGEEKFHTNVPTKHHPFIRFYSLFPIVDIPWLTPTLIKKSFLLKNDIQWDESVKLHQDIQFNTLMLSKNPVFLWIRDAADWAWNFNHNDNNIGKENNNAEESTKKLIGIYWYNLENATIGKNLKKQVNKQFHAQLIGFCDKLSYSLTNVDDFLDFIKTNSHFTSMNLRLLKQRIRYFKKLPVGLKKRIHWKMIRLYFKIFYSPVIKEGNFLKNPVIN